MYIYIYRGVEGHWNHPYNRPWATVDEYVKEPLARLVGNDMFITILILSLISLLTK